MLFLLLFADPVRPPRAAVQAQKKAQPSKGLRYELRVLSV